MPETPHITCIACSIFRPELEALAGKGLLDLPITYVDSNLHMDPALLHTEMEALLQEEQEQGHRVVLIIGDCHPYVVDQAKSPNVARVTGTRCGDVLLGRERYRILLKEKAFILFSEWILRWRELLTRLLDLDEESTIEIMRDEHAKFVYVDSGTCPVPHEELRACSEHFGLPYEVERLSLEPFLGRVQEALRDLA